MALLWPNKEILVRENDVNEVYKRPPSLTNWLPWLDYDEDSETFTLEDGYSAAVMFEVSAIPTEARSDVFLQNIKTNIQACISHAVPALDNPFVLQCIVNDEDSLASFSHHLKRYICNGSKPGYENLASNFLMHMQNHLKRIANRAGLFEDELVTGSVWRGRNRRVRVFLYRRRNINDHNEIDPVTEINQVAERLAIQMEAAGIEVRRCDDNDLNAFLVRWFNPKAIPTQGDTDALSELMALPTKAQRTFSHDLSDLLFLSQPKSDSKNGVWWFDNMPHRAISIDSLRRKPIPGHFTGERNIGDKLAALMDRFPEGSLLSISITIQPQDKVENHVINIINASKGETAEAMAAEQDAKDALRYMSQGDDLLPTEITVFTRGESLSDLQKQTNELNGLLLAHGLHPIRENDELLPIHNYIKNLPMNYEPERDKVSRKSRLTFASDLACLLPFYGRSRGTGHPGFTFFNRGGEPLTVDPLNRLDREKNAFGLVLGPPGSGKSALMVYLLLQIASIYGARIYIIEKGGSFKLFGDYCQYFGLNVNRVALHPNADVSLPPFADAYEMLKREEDKKYYEDEHAALDKSDDEYEERDLLGEMEIKARIMVTGGDTKEEALLTRADRLTIRKAIIQAAKAKLVDKPEEIVLVEDVVNALHKLSMDRGLTEKRRERAQDMADAMALYCQGTAGRFFNRPGKEWPHADVTIFEMAMLGSDGYEDQLALGITGLINQINGVVEREQYSNRFTFVLADEPHLFMSNPLLAILLVKIGKMWRKLGAWLWLATQNLQDFSGEAKKLLTMFEFWIAMVCSKEEIEQISRFKDLSDEQKAMLLAARKQPGKYTEGVLLSEKVQSLFRNVPPTLPLALAMTENEEKAERAAIMKEQQCTELEAAFIVAERLMMV